jgi:hypothetical protein
VKGAPGTIPAERCHLPGVAPRQHLHGGLVTRPDVDVVRVCRSNKLHRAPKCWRRIYGRCRGGVPHNHHSARRRTATTGGYYEKAQHRCQPSRPPNHESKSTTGVIVRGQGRPAGYTTPDSAPRATPRRPITLGRIALADGGRGGRSPGTPKRIHRRPDDNVTLAHDGPTTTSPFQLGDAGSRASSRRNRVITCGTGPTVVGLAAQRRASRSRGSEPRVPNASPAPSAP